MGGACALALLLGVLLLARTTRRLALRVAALESELSARPTTPTVAPDVVTEPAAYVITGLPVEETAKPTDDADPEVHVGRIDGALFADIVARESVIKAAGFAHGLRRAMSPETRNRIRFEVRRETKRARKQRRAVA